MVCGELVGNLLDTAMRQTIGLVAGSDSARSIRCFGLASRGDQCIACFAVSLVTIVGGPVFGEATDVLDHVAFSAKFQTGCQIRILLGNFISHSFALVKFKFSLAVGNPSELNLVLCPKSVDLSIFGGQSNPTRVLAMNVGQDDHSSFLAACQ